MPRTRSSAPVRLVCGCEACKQSGISDETNFISYQYKWRALAHARQLGWRKVWGVQYAPGHFEPKHKRKGTARNCSLCHCLVAVCLDGSLRIHFCVGGLKAKTDPVPLQGDPA